MTQTIVTTSYTTNTRFGQRFRLILASALPRICTRVSGSGLVVIVSLRTVLRSLKEEAAEENEQFAWATISLYHLETSVSRAKRIFKLRKFA